jgi:hypothetical protein
MVTLQAAATCTMFEHQWVDVATLVRAALSQVARLTEDAQQWEWWALSYPAGLIEALHRYSPFAADLNPYFDAAQAPPPHLR